MMFYSVFLINACFNIAFGTFTTNPPTNDKVCTGNSKQITWEYTTAQTVLVVEWKKDGNKIMGWDTTSNSYNYGAGFNAAKISHDNANAQVTLKNVDSSFIGIYTCEYVDGMGAQVTSGTYNLQVYDVITTPMACSCNTSEINCVLPASISQVTINGTVENLPFIPSTASTYNVCMTGDALFCLSNTIDSCEIVDLCPSGPETTTEEPLIPGESTIDSSIILIKTSHSTTIGSDKDSTDNVSIISTDQVTFSNASVHTESKTMLAPLVISVSVIISCLVVIFVVVLCVMNHKRHTKDECTSGNHEDLNPSAKNDHVYLRKISNNQKAKVQESRPRFISRTEYYPEISANANSHARQNMPEHRFRHDNTVCSVDNRREYRGQAIDIGNLPQTHIKSTDGGLSRQPR